MVKKTLFVILFFFCLCDLKGQTLIGHYYNSAVSKSMKFNIQLLDKGLSGKPCILIGVYGEAEKNSLMINIGDIPEFKEGLVKMKDKYIEWTDIAIKNKVKEMEKEMEYPFDIRIGASWLDGNWFFSDGFRWNLHPIYVIEKQGQKHTLKFIQEVSSNNNKYIKNRIMLIFSSKLDFESLIRGLNIDKINKVLEQANMNEELFK